MMVIMKKKMLTMMMFMITLGDYVVEEEDERSWFQIGEGFEAQIAWKKSALKNLLLMLMLSLLLLLMSMSMSRPFHFPIDRVGWGDGIDLVDLYADWLCMMMN